MIQAAHDFCNQTVNVSDNTEIVVERLETGMPAANHIHQIGSVANELAASLDQPSLPVKAAFGIPCLDALTGGMRACQSIVVAGRPGDGKSALALQSSLHNAQRGRSVLYVSLEMEAGELTERAVCSLANLDSKKFQIGIASDDEKQAFRETAQSTADWPLKISDAPRLSLATIRAMAKSQMARPEGLDLLVIDYLLLLCPSEKEREYRQQVASHSRQIKNMARELKIPILTLQQLNRNVETKAEPTLSNLAESSAIEQDADVVIIIREDQEAKEVEQENGTYSANFRPAKLYVPKQRGGQSGVGLSVRFEATYCRFTEQASVGREWTP